MPKQPTFEIANVQRCITRVHDVFVDQRLQVESPSARREASKALVAAAERLMDAVRKLEQLDNPPPEDGWLAWDTGRGVEDDICPWRLDLYVAGRLAGRVFQRLSSAHIAQVIIPTGSGYGAVEQLDTEYAHVDAAKAAVEDRAFQIHRAQVEKLAEQQRQCEQLRAQRS